MDPVGDDPLRSSRICFTLLFAGTVEAQFAIDDKGWQVFLYIKSSDPKKSNLKFPSVFLISQWHLGLGWDHVLKME